MSIALCLAGEFRTTKMWLNAFAQHLSEEQVVAEEEVAVDEVDIAIVRGIDPGNLHRFPNLRFIQCMWAGVDKLIGHPDVPNGVPLARTVDPAMADHMAATCVAHVLDIALGHHAYREKQTRSAWEPRHAKPMSSHTVAILGFGALGQRCAQQLRALGFNTVGVRSNDNLFDVLPNASMVVNLLPLTNETRGVLNSEAFAAMQEGASLVNLARGAHIVEADLLAALAAGRLKRAVLDVFTVEPLPAEHAFWGHPQITVTPHVAAETDPNTAAVVIANNIRLFRAGRVAEITGLIDTAKGY